MTATINRPSPQDMVERAAALAPRLRERSAACEQARVCPAESVRDFFAADLHRMLQPKRYGGYEMGWDTLCESAAAMSRGCGAQGWVLTIYNDHAQQLGMLDPKAQDDVWGADPRALMSASFFAGKGTARAVSGGAVLSGQWEFLSGVDHASWVFVGCALDGAGHFIFLVPKNDATVIDDWHVLGLAGTGSKSVKIDQAFVPAHRILNMADAESGTPVDSRPGVAPVYRMPRRAIAGLGLSSIGVGTAIGLLDEFVRTTKGRMSRGAAVAENQWVQLQVADASAALEAAEMLLTRTAARAMALLGRGETLTVDQRVAAKRNTAYATQTARQSADKLFAVAGGHHLHRDNALQRYYRDVIAATAHSALRWEIAAVPFGRRIFGLEPPPGGW